MFLKRFIFVNWGNVPNGEFEFGPVSLFSGANGSGKTTAADAVQTVMTAAHENLFHYNPGQDESTQRGRGGKRVRTLASYVLGCDDGSYARTEPTDGYIAAVFHPTREESAEAFTAVIGVRAFLDQSGKQALAREEQALFFILPEVELGLDAFVKEQGSARHVVLLDEIQQKLIAQHGKRAVERYDQKRAYLRRLYAALRGKKDSVTEREALAAARAFARFMAYKPVSSIHQFVAEEVLERKDLGEAIRSVSSQLKAIHGMEREAQSLKDSAALLDAAGQQAQLYLEGWVELHTLHYSRARMDYLQAQTLFLARTAVRESTARDLADNTAAIRLTDERQEQLRATLIGLEAQRQGIPALKQKDELEKQRAALDAKLTDTARSLLEEDQRIQRNGIAIDALESLLAQPGLAAELPELTDLHARQRVSEARATQARAPFNLTQLLQRDLTHDLGKLEKHLDEARRAQRSQVELFQYWRHREQGQESRRDRVTAARELRRQRHEQLSGQLDQKQREIERLEARQTVYPPYVEKALTAIRTHCPAAGARVLCDHIEVTDARWQAAIEGYLGGARFGIVVEADHEAQAIRIVRQLAGRDNRARVIQGARALRDAARIKPPVESIFHSLKFTHAIAQAYVLAGYGSVVRVESEEELRTTARGVTADGIGSGSYAMYRCDVPDSDLVFGAAARERALRARRTDVERLVAERQEANGRLQEITRLLEAVDQLGHSGYADALSTLLQLHRESRQVELLLSQLDLSDHTSLEQQLSGLREEETRLRAESHELSEGTGALKEELKRLAGELEELGRHKEHCQQQLGEAEEALEAVHGQWPQFDLEARLAYAEAEAKSLDTANVDSLAQEIGARLRRNERDLNAAITRHNQQCRPADAIVYTAFSGNYDTGLFVKLCALREEIDRILNILRNNVLIEKHEQLKQLKSSFNDAFVSHLCQEIHLSILDGKRQIDSLNRELVEHRFGSDRERFRFAQDWVPEFREYARFLEEVVGNPAIGTEATLFEAPLSAKSAQVRDTLMSLLLGADEHRSVQELERIADYRNYHRYEIYKEVDGKAPIPLSEYGTGSGGQLETPAYIIRSASITSALRYAEGTSHLRMVLVDEAFSKMDENRSREVIDYLTRSLGLQLIFIMPTSKCGPFMDLISNEFVFAKVPSSPRGQLNTRVLVDRKQCNQERIGDLWKRHRRTVRQQAELDFMDDVLTPAGAPVAAETPPDKVAARPDTRR